MGSRKGREGRKGEGRGGREGRGGEGREGGRGRQQSGVRIYLRIHCNDDRTIAFGTENSSSGLQMSLTTSNDIL